jgi:hypothetical protein
MDQTLELLLSQIADRRKQVLEGLGDGAAKDYASYQDMVGFIRGLSTVDAMIRDLAKRMETYDDE